MKITHSAILFIAIFILLFFGFGLYVDQVIDTNNSNLKEEQTLLASTDSALNVGEKGKVLVYGDENVRWSAVASLQNIYGKNNNTITEDKKVTNKYHLSTTFIIDWNGYYIEYQNSFQNENGNTESKEEMTNLNTWTETYGDYVVNFRLDEDVTVYHEQSTCSGYYGNIYESLGSPEALSFMSDPELFKEERNITIASIMNEQVNYYANTKNTWFNTYNANYLITINSAYDNDEVGVMDMPCMIALSQGTQTLTYRNYTDIFAFTASDLSEDKLYYIKEDADGSIYYHSSDCPDAAGSTDTGTLSDCAKEGAYPHDCVYLQ